MGVCPLCSVLCCLWLCGPEILLTTDSGRSVLLYLSSVLCNSLCFTYSHLAHGHLCHKFRGGDVNSTLVKVNTRRKSKINSFIHYLTLTSPLCLYVTPAIRALQSHDLSGEGINSGSHHTFLTTQGHGGLSGWVISTMPNMKDYTRHSYTHSFWQGEYGRMIMTAKWYSGILWA